MLESSLVDIVDTCSVEKSKIRMMELASSHMNPTSAEESYFIRPKLSNCAEAKSPSKLLFVALPTTSTTEADCTSTSTPLTNFNAASTLTKMPAAPPYTPTSTA
jgi:hypothetical protein